MAERIIKQLIDDLDGKDIQDGFGQRIEFSYQGTDYVIDLRATNAEKFDAAVKPFVEAAAKVGAKRGRPKGGATDAAKPSGSGRSKEELAAVRAWGARKGIEISPRGRISADVLAQFDEEHAPKK